MRQKKTILQVARLLSSFFRPSYYPVAGYVVLFTCSFLRELPWTYKFSFIFMIYVFTIAMPWAAIYIYRRLHGWSAIELRHQHRRTIPYIIYILAYLTCMHTIAQLNLPTFVGAIMCISLLLQCCCVVINMWWKVSMHSAGAGALIGALVGYAAIFAFNPIWWLCTTILISGLVNSSRMLLRQHTLWQVLGGTWIGFICGLIGILIQIRI